jgi:hypothetical protein
MPKKPSKELISTAYHEAGHAVAAHMLDIPLRHATVVPNHEEGSLGHVLYGRLSPKMIEALQSGGLTPGMRAKIENIVIATFAGGIAEHRYRGRRNLVGTTHDRHMIIDFLEPISGNIPELEAYALWLEQRAINLVARFWDVVEVVAAALLERHTLTGAQIRSAIYHGFDLARTNPPPPPAE